MSDARIAGARLANHRLARPSPAKPAELVAWFGAVQAQDYRAAKWAVAQRLRHGITDAMLDRAADEGRILRTHVLRPTWHFVAPEDIHWMVGLTAPNVHRACAWGHAQLGLDAATRTRAAKIIERALAREGVLTRADLGVHLAREGMPLAGVRLALVSIHAELERIICSGPRRGNQSTYALLDARVRRPKRLSRDEALGELTRRYFQSHGPATVRDFIWWSGLKTSDAKRGLEIARAKSAAVDGLTYWTVGRASTSASVRSDAARTATVRLLPVYDEYLVAYRDLVAVPRDKAFWGILPQAIVVDGQVAGTWKAIRERNGVRLEIKTKRALNTAERRRLEAEADRYGGFLGGPVTISP